jgi:excisionase family DNA binding protein
VKGLALSVVLPEELLEAVRREAREEARRVSVETLAALPKPEPAPVVLYMRTGEYAKRRALSKRTIETLIREGLPVTGRGRLRRIPVARADEWLERRGALDDDARERSRVGAEATNELDRRR